MIDEFQNQESSKMHATPSTDTRRRGLLAKVALALAAVLFGKRAAVEIQAAPTRETGQGRLTTEGEVLRTNVYRGRPPVEPLDTMIRFERADNNHGRAVTHEVLSLIHEEKGRNSYPWTIYAHLSTQHVEGDACVLCSRLHKKDAGWSCGLHSEVFNNDRGVSLGANIEMSNEFTGPADQAMNIGLNIQAKGPKDCQYGIQIHDGGGSFEKGLGLNGKGKVGLDLGGQFDVGVNAGRNTIRVHEGTCIELEETGRIRVRYRAGRVEFLNGDKCVGHIDVNGEDHAL